MADRASLVVCAGEELVQLQRTSNALAVVAALFIALIGTARGADTAVPGWDASAFRDESVIQIMTTEPDVGEHWSKLWVVVIDDQPYVRLGSRSYGRVQRNTTSPFVKLKVGDQEFDKVKLEEMPDMKDKVAAAMADKYFMDKLIRLETHPMVARLVPEAAPASSGTH
jgi:hypothetical protein